MMHVYFPDQGHDPSGIGGKAQNLLEIERMGIQVPKWMVIRAEELVGNGHTQTPKEVSGMRNQIEAYKWDKSISRQIHDYFGEHWHQKTYAVRSSASDEDGTLHSFAGQFQSFLHVPFNQVLEKIQAVWLSCLSETVLTYRKQNGLAVSTEMGIIVQEMVNADVSGVAFGLDPVSGRKDRKVVSSVVGLGEGLVSGLLDADHFEICDDQIKSTIRKKEYAFHRDESGEGIIRTEVPENQVNVPSLDKTNVLEIGSVLDQLETHFGLPQDIEFAYSEGQLYLLQTRPVTTTKPQGEYTLWDNSNIVESYPGITTPLTFSFISKMYERVYRQFVGLLGVTNQEIEQRKTIFENTLGLVRGRVYYNLVSWYKMLALLPGYSLNAEYMEQMMGVKERFELEEGHIMTKGMARMRILKMVFKMIRLHLGLSREKIRFQKHLDRVIDEYQKTEWESLSPGDIQQKYGAFETSLLLEWKAPLINDFFAMIWFGVFRKQIEKHFPDYPNLHNDLLCGSQDIISTAPIKQTMKIARWITDDEWASQLFLNAKPDEIWKAINNGSHQDLMAMIEGYLEAFGERCVGELKLETISYRQDPAQFMGTLKSYVTQGLTGLDEKGIDQLLKAEAEAIFNNHTRKRPILRKWLRWLLKNTRKMVSDRENLRFERTRGFGMVRTMFTALGKKWHQLGLIVDPRDIFFLELAEITCIENMSVELKEVILDRKNEFEGYQKQSPPQSRFYTYGQDFSDAYIYSTDKLSEASDQLQGIGCCPGKVKGTARVIHHPSEAQSLNGDILITTSTDPGWVTLFPSASAIIVERGSLLSHSAIVAREMGIPCIVGVEGLLRSVETGDELLMDGSTGDISILKADQVLN